MTGKALIIKGIYKNLKNKETRNPVFKTEPIWAFAIFHGPASSAGFHVFTVLQKRKNYESDNKYLFSMN